MMAAMQTQGVVLETLLRGLTEVRLPTLAVTGVALDSRTLAVGELFLAVSGESAHGIRFVAQALEAGAAAVVVDDTPGWREALPAGLDSERFPVPLIPVHGLRQQVGLIGARYYGDPSQYLHLVGVTGTNGKTSVSHFIAQCLHRRGRCGLMGTLGSGLFGALQATGHTTPDALTVQRELADLLADGARYCVMEVSSHGLEQGRVGALNFATAVFTNLTHEHLDYHGDMQRYAAAKRRLFDFPGLRHAVINVDDPVGRRWADELNGRVALYTYSLHDAAANLRAESLQLSVAGLCMQVMTPQGSGMLRSALLGRFNASNLLAALGALLAEGWRLDEALDALAQVRTVRGRMEAFGGGERPLVVVDYAHTPDALEQVLKALREHTAGRLHVVFGCGGDRDKAKRPLMGEVAARLADVVVVTDDNPRSESPELITAAICEGIGAGRSCSVIHDRAAAIEAAVQGAVVGDVVLVAGKGHETEQLVAGRTLPFSDREVVQQLLAGGAHD